MFYKCQSLYLPSEVLRWNGILVWEKSRMPIPEHVSNKVACTIVRQLRMKLILIVGTNRSQQLTSAVEICE